MPDNKDLNKDLGPGRGVRESEIFPDGPGVANYQSSMGAAQGIEVFGDRVRARPARPATTFREPARDIPVFAETDVLVVGGGPPGPRPPSPRGASAPR